MELKHEHNGFSRRGNESRMVGGEMHGLLARSGDHWGPHIHSRMEMRGQAGTEGETECEEGRADDEERRSFFRRHNNVKLLFSKLHPE